MVRRPRFLSLIEKWFEISLNLKTKKENDFSFSGLKSSVKREIDKRIKEKGALKEEDIKQIAFEFEKSVVEVLAYKLIQAALNS